MHSVAGSAILEIAMTKFIVFAAIWIALHAYLTNNRSLAKEHFKRAIDLEEAGHFFGPPEILIPAHEFYAGFLMAVNKPGEAMETFQRALQKTPGRNQSPHGLMREGTLAGDHAKERHAAEALKENLGQARTVIKGFFAR